MEKFNQAKYIQEYQKEKYDRCIFNIPKGKKEELKKHWTKKGYDSLNQYINDLIKKDMEKDIKNINVQNVNQIGDNNSINIG